MKAPKLAYLRARSLAEALDALAEHGAEASILAGGQSLVPALNMRLLQPRLLIDINHLHGLGAIAEQDGMLRLGTLVRHTELGRSPLVARCAPLIRAAVPHIAHAAIRNRGTLGGSLAQADPAAELPACIVALGATLHLQSRRGERMIAAGEFFRGLYQTALAADEIITAIDIPPAPAGTRIAFDELARRRGDYAIAGLAAQAERARAPRLVFFGIDAKPVLAARAAEALGKSLAAAQAALGEDLAPAGDLQADAATKLHLARVLLARAAPLLCEAA